jgi:hypothetical protein
MTIEKDWKKSYYDGHMPLYDVILAYMEENRVVPELLVQEFRIAIEKYYKGETKNLEIGLDFHYPESQAKRKSQSKKILKPVALKNKLDYLTKIGLKKSKLEPTKPHSDETVEKLRGFLKAHKVRVKNKPQEYFNKMTAYQALGEIFNTSADNVRKILENDPFKNPKKIKKYLG